MRLQHCGIRSICNACTNEKQFICMHAASMRVFDRLRKSNRRIDKCSRHIELLGNEESRGNTLVWMRRQREPEPHCV
jgi:hypothetical protein